MTIKLYAESGSRGFKANQIKIPIEKKLASLEKQGQQEVKNLDTVAKADLNRHKIYIDDKLRADKVQIDNIRDNHLFYERNREWIEKWEQKELDDRVAVARQEYQAAQQQRQPDKSLLEKLGPALAKGIPMIVGAVQQQQAIQAEADTEAGTEIMFRLGWTSSQLTEYRQQLAALGEDTAKREGYLQSILGTLNERGYPTEMSDLVRVLENGTGAYSIAAERQGIKNAIGQINQRISAWTAGPEGMYNFPDSAAFVQALDKKHLELKRELIGKDVPHAMKAAEYEPQWQKIRDKLLAAHGRWINNLAKDQHDQRKISELGIIFSENNYYGPGGFKDWFRQQIEINGGDKELTFSMMNKVMMNLINSGLVDQNDTRAMLDIARDLSKNPNLGIGENKNIFSEYVREWERQVLNKNQQFTNTLERETDNEVKKREIFLLNQIEQEGGSNHLRQKLRGQLEQSTIWPSLNVQQRQRLTRVITAGAEGAPIADNRTFSQRLGLDRSIAPVIKSHAKDILDGRVFDQTKVPLKSMGQKPYGLDGKLYRIEGLLMTNLQKVLDSKEIYRNPATRSAYITDAIEEAVKLTIDQVDAAPWTKIGKNTDNPSIFEFNSQTQQDVNVEALSEAQRELMYEANKEHTDTTFLGGNYARSVINEFASVVRNLRPGEEIQRNDIVKTMSGLHYIQEAADVLNMPPTELFAHQVKALHPDITIPDSAITTTAEVEGAGKRFQSLLNSPTPTGQRAQQGATYTVPQPINNALLKTGNIPATASTDATGFRDYDTSKYSPEEIALQDTIRFAEGTFSKDGYNTWAGFQKPAGYPTDFGTRDITSMHHWQTKFDQDGFTKKTGSAVYGGYQFLDGPAYARQAGLDPDKAYLNSENQDAMAQAALNNKGVTAEALRANGLTDEYIDKLAPTWASFPNLIGPDAQGRVGTRSSYYGQGGKTAEALKQFYQQRLGVYNKRGWGTMPSNPPGMDYGKSKKSWGFL